jgi:stringent starvation protein B
MRSRRPYLLRAMYEWMVDCGHTPHLLVDARAPGVEVPERSVHEGRIVLNVGPTASHRLVLGDERLEFDARFGGASRHVVVPVAAVLAIYARETGEGMMFGAEDGAALAEGAAAPGPEPAAGDAPDPDRPPRGRPTLKVIK